MSEEIVKAIRAGDVAGLRRMLAERPVAVRERADGERTLLHVATDWPGHFPNVGETIRLLVEFGADVNARFVGKHTETPLHWAASSDDLEALDCLLDLGADMEAAGGVVGGGTALADAVGFGQWKAARRLVERVARTTFWQCAALGMMERVREFAAEKPTQEELTSAFWAACHGGQLEVARFLLPLGADLNRVGPVGLSPLDAAERNGNAELVEWLKSEGARSAKGSAGGG